MNKICLFICSLIALVCFSANAQIVRVGMIGLDTSHSEAFIQMLNAAQQEAQYQGFKITVAYPYGSRTIESSYSRIPKYTKTAKDYGVEITGSIQELLGKCDVVLLETNDGNLHLSQAWEVIKAGKPLFVDKPAAATLKDAIAIFSLAERHNVPIFSSSALRFGKNVQDVKAGKYGKVHGADCYSPHHKEPSHPDFGWYGIHGIESLYTIMGTGCKTVTRMSNKDGDVVTGQWSDDRIGVFRALVSKAQDYGGIAFCENGIVYDAGHYDGYKPLLDQIIQFFKTKKAPVEPKETIEMFTFMEASNISLKSKGKPIELAKVYSKEKKEADKIVKELDK